MFYSEYCMSNQVSSSHSSLPGGLGALLFGFKLLNQKGLRLYAIMPVLLNILIFSTGFYYAFDLMEDLRLQFQAWLPEWLHYLSYILWPLFIISAGVIFVYGFTTITQLIASPFNAILSEKVEKHLGLPCASDENPLTFFQAMKSAIPRELSKFAKSLKWLLLMLILSFIPGINIVVPLIAAWIMAIDYLDFPADNRGMSFSDSLKHIQKRKLSHLLFGLIVSLVSLIPLVNLFVVPAAVAGATALWHQSHPTNT